MQRSLMCYAGTLLLIVTLSRNASAQTSPPPELIIRCDDIGMCHTVNMAADKLIATGLPFSASVMFVCPWYQEAVDLLKAHPQIAVGVHLTLNAEWKNYRWGPVLGEAVPSLIDSCGYFFPSRDRFFANQPKIEEVERELRAQIERAVQSGLKIDYLDYHMGTAVATPELRRLVEKLAREYRLGISRYFGEVDAPSIYAVAAEAKPDSLAAIVRRLETGTRHLSVHHIGLETAEMEALVDLNSFGLPRIDRHRYFELEALCADKFRTAIKAQNIRLLTYRDLSAGSGFDQMQPPAESGY